MQESKTRTSRNKAIKEKEKEKEQEKEKPVDNKRRARIDWQLKELEHRLAAIGGGSIDWQLKEMNMKIAEKGLTQRQKDMIFEHCYFWKVKNHAFFRKFHNRKHGRLLPNEPPSWFFFCAHSSQATPENCVGCNVGC